MIKYLIILLLFASCTKEVSRDYSYSKKDGFYTAAFYQNKFNYLNLYLNDGKVRRIIGWRIHGAKSVLNETYIDDSYYIDSVKYY